MAMKSKRGAVKKGKRSTPSRGTSLTAMIRTDLAKPVIPGEILFASWDIDSFQGREIKQLTVTKVVDRPVLVGHIVISSR